MKSRCFFLIFLLVGSFDFAMNKTGQSDQFYSSLLQLITAGDYDKAYEIFNARNSSDIIHPHQIASLRTAIDARALYLNSHPFYKQITAFLSIYSDALRGSLASNEYVDAVFKKS